MTQSTVDSLVAVALVLAAPLAEHAQSAVPAAVSTGLRPREPARAGLVIFSVLGVIALTTSNARTPCI